MKLLSFSQAYDRDDNLKIYAEIYSKKSKEDYSLWMIIDEFADNKIADFECTCKHWVIKKGQKEDNIKPCKHLKQLREWLIALGWEVKEFEQKKQNTRTVTVIE